MWTVMPTGYNTCQVDDDRALETAGYFTHWELSAMNMNCATSQNPLAKLKHNAIDHTPLVA